MKINVCHYSHEVGEDYLKYNMLSLFISMQHLQKNYDIVTLNIFVMMFELRSMMLYCISIFNLNLNVDEYIYNPFAILLIFDKNF